jgi:1-acyl-sn-glycerol-3-phosphate acyltransferase
MWALLVCGVTAALLAARWRRGGRPWFDGFEHDAMRLFVRLWHRCSAVAPALLPAQGPVLVVANHPNHSDPAFLLASCARPLGFLHAREQYNVFLLRQLFRRAGCIPVARDGRDVAGTRLALRRLHEGAALVIFPEGEVSRPGRDGMAPAKAGIAFLALRSRAPVYPVWIEGGPQRHDLLRDWLWPSRGVRLFFGPAVDLVPYYGRPIDRKLLQEVAALLLRRLADLRPDPKDNPGPRKQKSEVRSQKQQACPGRRPPACGVLSADS